MASRIPPLLDTYLRLPPEASLVLLSGVLGSTTNWLVLRYLYSFLSNPVAKEDGIDSPRIDGPGVVLVSFLRDYTFWKDGAGKLGIDLDGLSRKGKFVFVDGLTGLFHPSHDNAPKPLPGNIPGRRVLSGATLPHLRKELEDAVAQVQHSTSEQKPVLIADQLDLLLAASGDDISCRGLQETLLDIREVSCTERCVFDKYHVVVSGTISEVNIRFIIESAFHHCHLVCRRTVDVVTNYMVGEGACIVRCVLSARRPYRHQSEDARYGYGKRCQWCPQSHPGRRAYWYRQSS